ncbi:putative acyl-activating enzyme 19 isoform X2 [Cryptomeria japonica]|uniref:putative acyl-activating enzyme 19 isoform X2 n=1 Tax=Cryptomeria japonica TaxID=3369 RepID=UPI0027DAB145|nr:putative acyl-activating enzyme 19 isoform X2 [Cryptomeria japonica]
MAEEMCCISHAFWRAASTKPNKLAIIESNFTKECAVDVVYTYAELKSAVIALAARITNIFRGAHDPHVITPPEMDKGIHFDQSSSIEHMEDERTCDPNDADYDHIRNSFDLSEHNIYEMDVKHIGSSSCPNIVGIYIGPSAEYVIAVLAVLQSGGAFLPLDPSWPKERVLAMISASEVDLVISCSHVSSLNAHKNHEMEWLLEGCKCSILCLSYGYFKGSAGKFNSKFHITWPCQNQDKRLYCYLMYTSGSTGKPKGVCGTEKGLLNRFLWMETLYPFIDDDISCFKTAICFIDHLFEIIGPLLASTTLVIPSFDKLREKPLSIFNILKAYSVTRLTIVPSLMRALIPSLQSSDGQSIRKLLRILVLSGEVFPIWMWEVLHETLGETTILNLYGSTEVSGDCAYFDCKALPKILEEVPLITVPIGKPILGCELLLAEETDSSALSNREGEILVGGKCLAMKYLNDASANASKFIKLNVTRGICDIVSNDEVNSGTYFRTGDFARKLNDGNYVFIGRKDRMVKVNGQRVALEEIEYNMRKHPHVADAAVSFHHCKHNNNYIAAYVILKEVDQSYLYSGSQNQNTHDPWNMDARKYMSVSLRTWLEQRLPAAMIPCRFHFIGALPLLPSGKINYEALPQTESIFQETGKEYSGKYLDDKYIQIIKQVFRRVLMVEEISDSDDLFLLGGTSISAAHVAHTLGVDMPFIYKHPSPIKIHKAILQVPELLESIRSLDSISKLSLEKSKYGKEKDTEGRSNQHFYNLIVPETSSSIDMRYEKVDSFGSLMHVAERVSFEGIADNPMKSKLPGDDLSFNGVVCKPQKEQCSIQYQLQNNIETGLENWVSGLNLPQGVAFSRCNRIISQGGFDNTLILQNSKVVFRNQVSANICPLWKVLLHSCVDASPLVVIWTGNCYVFIGSHASKFYCIDASSGEVQWEAELGGRVECTAAVTDDFSQVVVGCYNGAIYFLAFLTGKIIWSFQTDGEVKSQPIIDKSRGLIWCGSHDHNVYALDPQSQSCVFKLACGGSIFGAPVYDMIRSKVYVATTSGRVTAVNLEGFSISISWLYESHAPIFGSLAVDSCTGYVICSMVNGNIIALSTFGKCVWQASTGGPIFSGPCISPALSSQVLVCSRDGFVYAFHLKQGNCLWKHFIGEPITSSAYVDETVGLVSHNENQQETVYRLVCVCSSSGTIHVLKVDSHAAQRYNVATSADFNTFQGHNVSSYDSNLTQTEGKTQNDSLNKFCTDVVDKCKDQNLKVQPIFSHELTKLELKGEIYSSPVMVGGLIFIGCRDDHVYGISIVI